MSRQDPPAHRVLRIVSIHRTCVHFSLPPPYLAPLNPWSARAALCLRAPATTLPWTHAASRWREQTLPGRMMVCLLHPPPHHHRRPCHRPPPPLPPPAALQRSSRQARRVCLKTLVKSSRPPLWRQCRLNELWHWLVILSGNAQPHPHPVTYASFC